jgi:hypothetical protein
VILDDATSQIYCTQLVEEESIVIVLQAFRKVVEQEGFFLCSLQRSRISNTRAGFYCQPRFVRPAFGL